MSSILKFKSISQQLRDAGWKKWGDWWWKPLPEWKGRMSFCQQLFCEQSAFEELTGTGERRKIREALGA